MLVAPFTIPVPDARTGRTRPLAIAARNPTSPFALAIALGWLAVGGLAMAFLPHSLVGANLGATLPFWLVGAPLINLAWLMRRRAASALAHALLRTPALRSRQRRGARRLPPVASRMAASRQERRSNIA